MGFNVGLIKDVEVGFTEVRLDESTVGDLKTYISERWDGGSCVRRFVLSVLAEYTFIIILTVRYDSFTFHRIFPLPLFFTHNIL